MKQKVWFITGASKGFGRILVEKLLARGDKVVATSRNIQSFEKIDSTNFLALEIKNLCDEKEVKAGVKKAGTKFKKIDVLVNNAGYGLLGAFEEISDEEMRQQFDVNVFGTFNVTRNILPIMRKQKSGQIVNIASIAAYVGYEYWTAYNASKFAIAGFSDSLKHELKPFNIRVLCIMPGPFKTDFLNSSSLKISTSRLFEYNTNSIKGTWEKMDKKQDGDPEKAMDALINLVDANDTTIDKAFFGKWAYENAKQQIENTETQMDKISNVASDLEYK